MKSIPHLFSTFPQPFHTLSTFDLVDCSNKNSGLYDTFPILGKMHI